MGALLHGVLCVQSQPVRSIFYLMGSFRNVSLWLLLYNPWQNERSRGLRSEVSENSHRKTLEEESMNETHEVAERCKFVWHHRSQRNKAVMGSSWIILYLTPPLTHISKSFQHQLQNISQI